MVVPEDFGVGAVSGIFGGLAEPVDVRGLVAGGVSEAFGVGVDRSRRRGCGCGRDWRRGRRGHSGGSLGDRDDRAVDLGGAFLVQRGKGGGGGAEHEDRRGGEDHSGRTPARAAPVEAAGGAGAALQAPILAGVHRRAAVRAGRLGRGGWLGRLGRRARRRGAWSLGGEWLLGVCERRWIGEQCVHRILILAPSGIYLGAGGPSSARRCSGRCRWVGARKRFPSLTPSSSSCQ